MTGKAQGLAVLQETSSALGDEHERRLTALYKEHVDFVWRSVRTLGLDRDMADDAVQDVFLVAHRRLGDFEARSKPRTWLFAIAIRVVSDHRRSRRRRHNLTERAQNMDVEPTQTPCDPFHSVAGAEQRKLLLDAIDALPQEQRVVFTLTEVEDMSAPDIATALDVNVNTVYSRLRAARRAVALSLQEQSKQDAQE
ncbi:MAG: hypothetical protein RL701_1225 [Pseudomonadota bacterium]